LQARLEASGRSLSLSGAYVSGLEARLEASERSLSLSDAHISKLQARLEAYGGVLSDVDKELLLLRNQLADLSCKDAKKGDGNQALAGDVELIASCGDEGRDIHATLVEAKKLRELLDRLEAVTTAREIGWEALSKEHHLMLDKVDHLECALKEQRALVSEKQQALEMNQAELLGVTSKLQEIQHLLQAQIEETESLRLSKAELEVYMHTVIKTQDMGEPEANIVKADKLIETGDVDKLEFDAPKANGLIKTEDLDELESTANGFTEAKDSDDPEAEIPRADRLFESQDVDYDLVKIFDSVSESGSETRDSIDSEFDEMLDGTLDDLLKICSTSVTPASTPKSSVLSPNSGSKKFQYF
jgi:chromosome segregation ATPase